jgi:hypothetical protein
MYVYNNILLETVKMILLNVVINIVYKNMKFLFAIIIAIVCYVNTTETRLCWCGIGRVNGEHICRVNPHCLGVDIVNPNGSGGTGLGG